MLIIACTSSHYILIHVLNYSINAKSLKRLKVMKFLETIIHWKQQYNFAGLQRHKRNSQGPLQEEVQGQRWQEIPQDRETPPRQASWQPQRGRIQERKERGEYSKISSVYLMQLTNSKEGRRLRKFKNIFHSIIAIVWE